MLGIIVINAYLINRRCIHDLGLLTVCGKNKQLCNPLDPVEEGSILFVKKHQVGIPTKNNETKSVNITTSGQFSNIANPSRLAGKVFVQNSENSHYISSSI